MVCASHEIGEYKVFKVYGCIRYTIINEMLKEHKNESARGS